MENLIFSSNFNNKLNCKAFTTIRMYNKKIHWAGNVLNVVYNGIVIKQVTIWDVKILKLDKLNDWICFLDTGYNKIETTEMLYNMWKNYNFTENTELAYMLLNTEKTYKTL